MTKKTFLQAVIALIIPVVFYSVVSGFKSSGSESTGKTNVSGNIISNTVQNPAPYIQKDFVNFILNESYSHTNMDCYDELTNWHMENFLTQYRSQLGFNGVHMYDFFNGSECMGLFAQDLTPPQSNMVKSLINGAHANGLKAIFMRSNLSDLCRSQRLVYEVTQPPGNNTVNYGFCYKNTSGKYETEPDGTTSIHACVNPNDCETENFDAVPQYICQNIYENLQHTDLPYFQLTERETWYLKPRMKIKQSDFNDINKQALPVVTIEVLPFAGGLPIAYKTIKVRNFKDQSGQYTGLFTDIFNFIDDPSMNLEISGSTNGGLNTDWDPDPSTWETDCKVDFKIYWHGNVDVWFDKLTVDDFRANRLFNPDPSINFNRYMDGELSNFQTSAPQANMDIFFCDELTASNIEASKYVINYVRNKPGHSDTRISVAATNYLNNNGMRNDDLYFKPFLESIHPDYFQVDSHPILGWKVGTQYFDNFYPNNITPVDPKVPTGNGLNHEGWAVDKEDYNNSLQNYYFGDRTNTIAEHPGAFVNHVAKAKEQIDLYSPNTRFIMQPQIHAWIKDVEPYDNKYDEGLREPLNEEYEAQAMISIAHGADGLSWFWFNSFHFEVNQTPLPNLNHSLNIRNASTGFPYREWYYGLINLNNASPRTQNMFGQNKWEGIGNTNKKILNWKPILDNTNWQSGWSVHSEGAGHEYISDLQSINTNSNSHDPTNERYWEMGFYDPLLDGNFTRYFILSNRRCVPNIPEGSANGDFRQLKVKFNGSELMTFNNWSVVDVTTGQTVCVFPRLSTAFYDFGTFNPGEGRLYRIAPTFVTGGELVEDEDISGVSFICEAPVYNNGQNVTFGSNTNIRFRDSSFIEMDGGVFTVGDQNTSAPQNITSDAVSGSSWSGHTFTNCEVKIYGATFTGLANDTTYAVNIIDCPVVDIRNCTFNTNSSLKGGINAVFFSDPNNEISLSNIYIGANTFNSSGSTIPTVNISSFAGETSPLIIENNTFNEGNTAIILSGITGGAIKGNSITDNFIGINALTSSIDIKSNTISSTVNNAIGIFAAGGSELKMINAGSKTLGGLNDLSNSGTAANNIVVDGSVFLLDGGQNIFNITDDQTSKHLYGYFPMFTAVSYDEKNNCFKLNSSPVDPPYNVVTSGFQGSQITFNFTPYLTGCEANEGGDGFAVNLGDGIYDTIYNEGSGSGGSNKQIPLSRGVTAEGSRGVFIITTAKQKYDSISILMRYRNYTQARTKCLDLINTYPDSIQSLNAVSKLFLSTVASDTSYNAVNELKTYYENLILNNSGNVSLVKRANYYILKCKVRMREYSQALAGFQQIINQNPYSYEGLIARWDYMATSLLIQGQGGGERGNSDFGSGISDLESEELFQYIDNNPQSESHNPKSTGDKQPFTKEQRQDIRKSINTAIEISKTEDDRKIKSLEDRSGQGDVNASKELSQMLTLKQVIKTDRPKSITEHVRIVSEDIRKVFGSNTSSKGNEPKNIPLVFRLSQNYPNPFNPVTKINYDLPKDSKVNIVIYDILGREVKRLVNSELKTAGSYIVDFNASNYASGVYFYRIEAEEPNGNKFVDSKKMVLIK